MGVHPRDGMGRFRAASATGAGASTGVPHAWFFSSARPPFQGWFQMTKARSSTPRHPPAFLCSSLLVACIWLFLGSNTHVHFTSPGSLSHSPSTRFDLSLNFSQKQRRQLLRTRPSSLSHPRGPVPFETEPFPFDVSFLPFKPSLSRRDASRSTPPAVRPRFESPPLPAEDPSPPPSLPLRRAFRWGRKGPVATTHVLRSLHVGGQQAWRCHVLR